MSRIDKPSDDATQDEVVQEAAWTVLSFTPVLPSIYSRYPLTYDWDTAPPRRTQAHLPKYALGWLVTVAHVTDLIDGDMWLAFGNYINPKWRAQCPNYESHKLPVAVVPVVIRSGPRSTESAFVCTYANNYYTEERLNVACNDVGVMQAARNVFGIKDNTPPKWYICQIG